MTPTATAWYQQTAVLDAGSTVAGLLAVVATVWAAVYAARPGRALLYLVRRWRPPEHGEVSPFDVPLAAGRLAVADIQLRGGGRQDIPSAAFDAGRTITIGVNGSILTLLTTSSFPGERAGPARHDQRRAPAGRPGADRPQADPHLPGAGGDPRPRPEPPAETDRQRSPRRCPDRPAPAVLVHRFMDVRFGCPRSRVLSRSPLVLRTAAPATPAHRSH